MARILIIYHRQPGGEWRATYGAHLASFRRFANHDCYYLNTARGRTPKYLRMLKPDLVIYHYTFLAWRLNSEEFRQHADRVRFTAGLGCPKALMPHDEQARGDLLSEFVRDFGVSHVLSPAPPSERRKVYRGVDFERVRFHTVLGGYVDELSARRVARRARRLNGRPLEIGYRCGSTWPFYGRHGRLKMEIGHAFLSGAAGQGLRVDISAERSDLIFGRAWLSFLLKCKYTIGVEAGSSILDWDGDVASRTFDYLQTHDNPFEDVEEACFPGLDGQFNYRLISPRHFEAIMAGTCQILIEGEYGGVLEPGRHYIELKKDFSNLDAALLHVKRDDLRSRIVECARADIVDSGRYGYSAFVETVLEQTIGTDGNGGRRPGIKPGVVRNRLDELLWPAVFRAASILGHSTRVDLAVRIRAMGSRFKAAARPLASAMLGEQRLSRLLHCLRREP